MQKPDVKDSVPVYPAETDWDDEPSESAMEKMNGGCTSSCPFCDGTGMKNGAPCYSCGGSGWRR